MKQTESYNIKIFDGWISSYFVEVINALEYYSGQRPVIASDKVVKKNFIGECEYFFLMNIKEIVNSKVNDKYAFFYLALDKESFSKVSETFCKYNHISSLSDEIMTSSVKESCNRIGSRLLRFISSEGSMFDIGTPKAFLVSKTNPAANNINVPQMREWPFSFYSTKLEIAGIPIEFGCTILENIIQRKEMVVSKILNSLKGRNQYKLEQEIDFKSLPELFNVHIIATTITDSKVCLSFSKRYLSNVISLLDNQPKGLDMTQTIIQKIKSVEIIKDAYVVENMIPEEFSHTRVKIGQVTNSARSFRLAMSFVMD